MEPKKILKIRLRPDGTWENVYEYGYDSEDSESVEDVVKELEYKMAQYAALQDLHSEFIESALEYSNYEESKDVLSRIMQMK